MTTIRNDWEPETRSLFNTLKKHGLKLLSIDNGEDVTQFAADNYDLCVSEAEACEQSWLKVEAPDGKRLKLFLVYGNSPGELVCDYTCHPLLDVATDEHYARWDGKKQPTKEANN